MDSLKWKSYKSGNNFVFYDDWFMKGSRKKFCDFPLGFFAINSIGIIKENGSSFFGSQFSIPGLTVSF